MKDNRRVKVINWERFRDDKDWLVKMTSEEITQKLQEQEAEFDEAEYYRELQAEHLMEEKFLSEYEEE